MRLILLFRDWDLIMWGVLPGGSRFIFMKATHCVTLECLCHMPLVTLKDTQVMECSQSFPFLFFPVATQLENVSVIDGGSFQTAWQNFPFRLRKLLFFFLMLHLELNAWTVHNTAESSNKWWLILLYIRTQLPFAPNEMSYWEEYNMLFFNNCSAL